MVIKGGGFVTFSPRWKDEFTEQLFAAILKLENKEECYRFFEDIATVGETKALAQRLEVARMLWVGCTYDEIAQRTGVSTATISRVKKYLYYGGDGYKIILERLKQSGELLQSGEE
jgi:TrpR-related protein YerC/YecD